MLVVVGLISILATQSVQARMYQWRNPLTGTMQVSGKPPAWYRGEADGPRVWVYDGGFLVDDTAISVTDEQAEKLRGAAFEEHEARQRAERLNRLERLARRQELRRRADERRASADRTETGGGTRQGADSDKLVTPSADTPLDDSMVGRLKDLIRDFDRQGGSGGR
ncbi:MAG: hypothetical protein KDK91_09910 [Gammaproteobacteria bacterium]|nr:hypothetical protein [Gammaproteobacteria bacterium]